MIRVVVLNAGLVWDVCGRTLAGLGSHRLGSGRSGHHTHAAACSISECRSEFNAS